MQPEFPWRAIVVLLALLGVTACNSPGPEAPLVAGIADAMEAAGIACCGPPNAAARLEGSKTFAKEIADAASTPTAPETRFEEAQQARTVVRRAGVPLGGSAAGRGGGQGAARDRESAGGGRRQRCRGRGPRLASKLGRGRARAGGEATLGAGGWGGQ